MARQDSISAHRATQDNLVTQRRAFLKRNTALLVGGAVAGSSLNSGCGVLLPPGLSLTNILPNFEDMNYGIPFAVALDTPGEPTVAMIEGNLRVSNQGVVNGSMVVSWLSMPGLKSTITVVDDSISVVSESPVRGGNSSDLFEHPADSPATSLLIGGVEMETATVLDNATQEWLSSSNPADHSAATLNLAALTVLGKTAAFQRFAKEAEDQQLLANSFACKMACLVPAGIVAGLGGLGCAAVIAACAVGDVFTIGGVTLPCALLIVACFGVDFIAAGVVHEICLAAWS